jgi:hypothetical protein
MASRDFSVSLIRRYLDHYESPTTVFLVYGHKILAKLDLTPTNLKHSPKITINDRRVRDLLVDYHIIDTHTALIMFTKAIAIYDIRTQTEKWWRELDNLQSVLIVAPQFQLNHFPVVFFQNGEFPLQTLDIIDV